MVRRGSLKMPLQCLQGVLCSLGGSYNLVLDKAKPSAEVGCEKGGIKMRKLFYCMATIAIIATIALLPAEGYSKPTWMLYDDFNSGVIDDRWTVIALSGDIYPWEGMARFDHIPPPNPGDINLLLINMNPGQLRKIKGIRVTVRVDWCTGYPMAGIGAYIGKVGEYYVFDHIYLHPGAKPQQIISCGLPLFELPPPVTIWGSLFNGEFGDPGQIIENTFTITIMFSEKSMMYEVSGLGTIIRELPQKLDPTDNYFRALVTVANGNATVYFDDVYILK
jgi:hypothetical protein